MSLVINFELIKFLKSIHLKLIYQEQFYLFGFKPYFAKAIVILPSCTNRSN